MTVAVKPDGRHAAFGAETFNFCSENCQTKFKEDPWFYAMVPSAERPKVAPADVQYTCSICDMVLEPMVPSDEPSEELADFTRSMWISAAAAVPSESRHTAFRVC